MRKYQDMSLVVLSGFLLGVGFVLPYLWPLSFVGMALLLYIIVQTSSWKRATSCAYLVGVISWAFALGAFFFGVLPLDWYGVTSSALQVTLVTGSLILTASVAAIGFALAAVSIRFLYTRTWRDVFIIPSIWVLSEYAAAMIFYGISFGSGSYLGPHFSFGWMGYLLADDRIIRQAASFGGVYVLSFIVVFIGTLLLRYAQSTDTRIKMVYAAVLIGSAVFWAGAHVVTMSTTAFFTSSQQDSATLSVAAVSRYQPPSFSITKTADKRYFEETYQAIKPLKNIDVLIFPEETSFLNSFDKEREGNVQATLRRIGVLGVAPTVIDSLSIRGKDGLLQSRVSYYKEGTPTQFGYKQFLVPIGEYLPKVYLEVLRMFGLNEMVATAQNVRGHEAGRVGGSGFIDGTRVSTRFCSEVASPELYRKDVVSGAKMLINISSLSWFHGSRIVYEQVKRIAKVRAVENGRWYVQSGNMAPAFVLNQYGDVIAETPWDVTRAVSVSVPLLTHKTPYVAVGSGILLIPFFLILLLNPRNKQLLDTLLR